MKELFLTVLATLSVPVIVTYAVLGALWLYRHVSKQSTELKEKRIADVKTYVHQGYLIVADVAAHTTNVIDDKIALALQYIDEGLAADGKPVLTTLEKQSAALKLSATHGSVTLSSALAKDAAAVLLPPETISVEPKKVVGSPS
jgi:hypothetical protein